MNAKDEIEQFISSLNNSSRIIDRKHKFLLQFLRYLELNEDLTGELNFDKAEKLIYGNRILRIPLSSKLITKYLSHVSPALPVTMYNSCITTLKQFCEHLVEMGILKENPVVGQLPRKYSKKDMTPYRLTRDESSRLLHAAYSYDQHRSRNFTLVLMLLSTAVRIGEALNLTESDVRTFLEIIDADGKTGERRRFLTPGLSESIDVLLKDPLRKQALDKSKTNYLFYSTKGGPLTPIEANKLIKAFALKVD